MTEERVKLNLVDNAVMFGFVIEFWLSVFPVKLVHLNTGKGNPYNLRVVESSWQAGPVKTSRYN
jgi:hypothetical protein